MLDATSSTKSQISANVSRSLLEQSTTLQGTSAYDSLMPSAVSLYCEKERERGGGGLVSGVVLFPIAVLSEEERGELVSGVVLVLLNTR